MKQNPKKAGRPKLPEGSAKGVMLRVRVTQDVREAIEKATKVKDHTIPEWVRGILLAKMGA